MLTLMRRLNAGDAVFDFIGSRKRWYWVSVALLLLCVGCFDLRGFNLNAKLDIDPDFLKDETHAHDDHAGHDHAPGEPCDRVAAAPAMEPLNEHRHR